MAVILYDEWLKFTTSPQYFSFVHRKKMTIEKKLRALFTQKKKLDFYMLAKYV